MGVLGVKFLQPLVVLCWLLRGRRVVSSDKGFALYISKESYLCKIVAVCLEFFSRYHTYHLSLWTCEHFTDWAVLLLLSSQLYRWRCQGWCGYPSPKACSEFTPRDSFSPQPRGSLFAALMFWHWDQVFSYLKVQWIILFNSVFGFRVLFCLSNSLNLART